MFEIESVQICCGPDVIAEYREIDISGEPKWVCQCGPCKWEEITDPDDRNHLMRLASGDDDLLKFCIIGGVEYTNLSVCVVF